MTRYQSFAFVDLAGRHGELDNMLEETTPWPLAKPSEGHGKDYCWAYGKVTTMDFLQPGKLVEKPIDPHSFLPREAKAETNEYFPAFVEHDEEYAEDCDEDDEDYEDYYEDPYEDDDEEDDDIEDDFDPTEN